MTKLADAWRPWRGVAAHLLWKYYARGQGPRRRDRSSRRASETNPQRRTEGNEWPNSTARGSSRAAVKPNGWWCFLHGYGADGNDLIDHRPRLAADPCRDRLRLAARAGAVRAGAGRQAMVRADLPRSGRALGRRQQGRARARSLSRQGIGAPEIAAVGAGARRLQPGHHDGAACRPAPPGRALAAIVGYSGMLVMPNDRRPRRSRPRSSRKPPVLLVHGDEDELIPVQALFHATQTLAALEIPAEWHISHGRRPWHRRRRAAAWRRVSRAPIQASRAE